MASFLESSADPIGAVARGWFAQDMGNAFVSGGAFWVVVFKAYQRETTCFALQPRVLISVVLLPDLICDLLAQGL